MDHRQCLARIFVKGARLIYGGKSTSSDYHGEMNSEKFFKVGFEDSLSQTYHQNQSLSLATPHITVYNRTNAPYPVTQKSNSGMIDQEQCSVIKRYAESLAVEVMQDAPTIADICC